jgi:hypothetical protein
MDDSLDEIIQLFVEWQEDSPTPSREALAVSSLKTISDFKDALAAVDSAATTKAILYLLGQLKTALTSVFATNQGHFLQLRHFVWRVEQTVERLTETAALAAEQRNDHALAYLGEEATSFRHLGWSAEVGLWYAFHVLSDMLRLKLTASITIKVAVTLGNDPLLSDNGFNAFWTDLTREREIASLLFYL